MIKFFLMDMLVSIKFLMGGLGGSLLWIWVIVLMVMVRYFVLGRIVLGKSLWLLS